MILGLNIRSIITLYTCTSSNVPFTFIGCLYDGLYEFLMMISRNGQAWEKNVQAFRFSSPPFTPNHSDTRE